MYEFYNPAVNYFVVFAIYAPKGQMTPFFVAKNYNLHKQLLVLVLVL